MGRTLMILGFLVGGANYLVTAFHFFFNDQALLGVILLLVPPSELVLPWVASTTLGIVSAIGLVLMIAGAALSKDS